MAEIKIIKANNVEIYPVTHEDVVVDNNGLSFGFRHQPKTDNFLSTTAKTIVGGINEVNSKKVINDAQNNAAADSVKIRYVKNTGARIYPICHANNVKYTNGETLTTTFNSILNKATSVTNRTSTAESNITAMQSTNTTTNGTLNTVSTAIGSLKSLQTSATGNLVAAVNEINQFGSNLKTRLKNALKSKGLTTSSTPIDDASINEMVALIESEDVGYKLVQDPSWTVENVPGSTYHFEKNANNNRWVSKNKGKHNSAANAIIRFENPQGQQVVLNYRCYAETNFDFGLIAPLNTVMGVSYSDTVTGATKLTTSTANFTTMNLTTATSGFYYIKYKKDSSSNIGDDDLRFEILFV